MAPDTQLDELDAEIEVLRARLDTYRKGSTLSRALIWGGGIVLALVLTVAGPYRTPPVVFGSIAAVLGGIVWFGATKASREDAEARLATAESQKARLFDEVAARNGWWDMTPTVH